MTQISQEASPRKDEAEVVASKSAFALSLVATVILMEEQVKQYKEVLPFLHDRNPNARNVALANILPLTVAGAPLRSRLFFEGVGSSGFQKYSEPDVVRDLKLLCRDQPATAHDAFRALVNLSDSSLLAPSLAQTLFLEFLTSYIVHPTSLLSDLACMLLSNITAHPTVAAALTKLEVDIVPLESLNGIYAVQSRCATSPPPDKYPAGTPTRFRALSLLVDAFTGSATISAEVSERKGQLHFLASVFANISSQAEGRNFFLSPQKRLPNAAAAPTEVALALLLPFTEHPDTIRRGGVASTIKNCSFVQEAHKVLLSPESEVNTLSFAEGPIPGLDVLPRILLPLAGPEEFELDDMELLLPALQFLPSTKTREPDPVLRLMHIESLILLCSTRWGREVQRRSGVYEIVRTMHETEADEQVVAHVDRLVNLLKRDEAPDEEPDRESSTPQTPAIAHAVESKTPDSEDEDEQITEI